MNKIVLCKGKGCPIKEKCNRFKSKPDPFYQSLFWDAPYDKEKETCEYFYPTIKNK